MVKLSRTLATICAVVSVIVWIILIYAENNVANEYYVNRGESLSISTYVSVNGEDTACNTQAVSKQKAVLKLFGIFPIKEIGITASDRKLVVPGGIPFGVKMTSNGVIVTAISAVNVGGSVTSPAKLSGIQSGDVIISIDGKSVYTNNDVVTAVNKSKGKSLRVGVKHQNGQTEQIKVTPILDPSDKTYKIGVLVRDSSAGIGTVTFYDQNNSTFGGLGHAVCDTDTLSPLTLLDGKVVIAEIDSVTKGKNGSPGQLNGHFASPFNSGEILKNDQTGVYGTLRGVKAVSDPVEVAFKQEVKTGKATILTTIEGKTPEEFEVEIELISQNSDRLTKNMLIRVTDERLLEVAGGIVQGMSGSPILQNGRLVGAVTHVLVDDCTRGYAIFAENMLETAQSVAGSNSLKDAS